MEYLEGGVIPLGHNLKQLIGAAVHIEDTDEDFDLQPEQLVKALKMFQYHLNLIYQKQKDNKQELLTLTDQKIEDI